jgi:U3 small nucleolar RNA-associated protein 20
MLRLANDDDQSCRVKTANVIKQLFGRISSNNMNSLMRYIETWMAGERLALVCAAIQMVGIAGEVLQHSFQSYLPSIMKALASHIWRILNNHKSNAAQLEIKDQMESVDLYDQDESSIFKPVSSNNSLDHWTVLYYCLVTVEKCFQQLGRLVERQMKALALWKAFTDSASYPHTWVRIATLRIQASYLSTLSLQNISKPTFLHQTLFENEDQVVILARQCCSQVQSEHLSTAMHEPIVIILNIISVIGSVHVKKTLALQSNENTMSYDGNNDQEENHNSDASDEENEDATLTVDNDENDTIQVSLTKPAASVFTPLDSQNQFLDNLRALPQSLFLRSLIRRLSHIVRRHTSTSTTSTQICIIKYFLAISSSLPLNDLRALLISLLFPLYRVIENEEFAANSMDTSNHSSANKNEPQSLLSLAQKTMESLQERIGSDEYLAAYACVRQRSLSIRTHRKRNRQLLAVKAPHIAARKKMEKHQRKREKGKVRIIEMKYGLNRGDGDAFLKASAEGKRARQEQNDQLTNLSNKKSKVK